MRGNQDPFASGYGRIRKVSYILFDFSGFQRLDQSILIHQKVTGKVQKDHALFHLVEGVLVDHLLCVIHQRNMNGDVITLGVDLVQSLAVVDGTGQIPGSVDGKVRIITIYVHSQRRSRIGNHGTDRAKTDDAQLLSGDLAAGELFLLFFGKLVNILAVFFTGNPLDTASL